MDKWIKPFSGCGDQEYHYFSIDKITEKVRITLKVYNAGKALVSSGQAFLRNANFGYMSHGIRQGMIGEMQVEITQQTSVRVIFAQDELLGCRCRDPRCYQRFSKDKGEVCEHEAAALILMQEYLIQNRPGDSTDLNAAMFLEMFSSTQQTDHSKRKSVHVIPRLSHDYDDLSLRILITSDACTKTYIVKNLTELFETVQDNGTYPLGKNNEIDFSQETFAEDCEEFARTLKGWILDKQHRERDSWYSREDDLKNYVRLYGDRVDRFFELFENTDVEYESKGHFLHLKTENPPLHLKISKLTGAKKRFEGVAVTGELLSFYYGNQFVYCITDGCFCRMEKAYSRKLEPLMGLRTGKENQLYFQIGRKKLSEFYYSVLPVLRQTAIIEENDSEVIEQYLPPEVAFKFYLDVDQGRPECRVGTWYGETGVAIFDLLDSGMLKDDFRDTRREKYVLEIVQHYFPEFRREEERFLASDDPDEVYDILETAVPKLMELGDVVCTDRFQSIQVRRKLKISVGVSIESDLLNLEIATETLTQQELLDIIKSYQQHKKYHRLKSGEFVDIDDSIAELSAMLDTMHITPKEFVKGKMQIPAYRALYLDKMLEQSQEIYAKRDTHYKQLIKSFKTVTESDFEIPESLYSTMRGYQRFGHKWLRTVGNSGFGGILADDMGLGKTLQMISVMLASKQESNGGTSLVVCPASLVFNWGAEFEKFAPEMRYCTVVGTQKERAELIARYQEFDVLITSYDLLKRDTAEYEDCEFFIQVLDEAQYIKNHTTAAAKSVKLIHARQKFALTGTPIENRLSELWSIFDYLMPGFLYGYETFKKEFETPIVKHSDEEATKRLRRMTSPFILRRLKQDVLRDLPDKLEESYVVRFDEEQRHLYDAKVLELRELLEHSGEGFQNIKLKIFSYLTQIRQICCDPALLFENYTGESAKKTACMEIVRRAIEGEHRMLIFSQFTTMLERLETELTEQGIPYYKITGETSKKKRLELVDSFNHGDTPVFLISLKAGGTGLNLTGADMVIHYDPWWNVAGQNQATDRAHRIGQTKTVTVYKLIARNTIEEKIQQMQEKKQSLADSILSGEFVNLTSLSREELLEILR